MTKKSSVADLVKELKKSAAPVRGEKLENLNTGKEIKKPKKPKKNAEHGGARPGAGRQPGGQSLARRTLRAILAKHYAEDVDITITDPLTNKEVTVKKPRVLAVMEKMYEMAVAKTGDSTAGDRWLNRALGKAPQPLIGDEEEDPVQVDLGVGRILGKVYGDDSDEE